MQKWLVALLMGLFFFVGAKSAFAQVVRTCATPPVAISGTLDPLTDLDQNGRLNRGSAATLCNVPTSAPPVTNPGSRYTFDAYTFRNRTAGQACISVRLQSTADISAAAYSTFDKERITSGYLGDSGNRASVAPTFSFRVNSLQDFTIVVTEGVDGAGGDYTLTVAGCGEILFSTITPNFGPVAGNAAVTLKGAGFLSGATVEFDGIPATNVVVVDDFTITARTPAHVAGAVDVTVTNTDGTTATKKNGFTYWDPITASLALTSNADPSVFGQTVTFRAAVTPTVPRGASGTVTFFENGNPIGTGALNASGVATFSLSTLAVGEHPITASYAGDALFKPATSNQVDQTVGLANTTTTLQSSSNPSIVNQSIVLIATVKSSAPGSGTPTGSVEFREGATVLGSASLFGGVAALDISSLSVGSHDIVASYQGSTSYNPSTSAKLTQVVNLAGTTLVLSSSLNPSTFGASVTFTAKVTSSTGGIPTGTIAFTDNDQSLGQAVTIDASGEATFTTSDLAVGSHPIKAVYSGDGLNQPAAGSLSQIVNVAATTVTLASSRNPSTLGDSVTFTATVDSAITGTISGNVTFKDGTTTIGTGTLDPSKQATFTTSELTLGTHTITAVYGGNTTFDTSTSNAVDQVVEAAKPDGGVDGGDGGTDSGVRDSGIDSSTPGVDASRPVDDGGIIDTGHEGNPISDREIEGGGCDCRSASGMSDLAGGLVTFLAAMALVGKRRRRRSN
jgi:MYXO-CTERM domain-containing protein